jgi:hypothetical protein
MINILQFQIDSAGNQGWILVDIISIEASDALAYLQNLSQDGHSYAAEIVNGLDTTRIAQVP